MKHQVECRECRGEIAVDDDREAPSHGLCGICASIALEQAVEFMRPLVTYGKAVEAWNGIALHSSHRVATIGTVVVTGADYAKLIWFYDRHASKEGKP